MNAIANQFKGKGYERVGHYGGEDVVQLIFLDIANIHVVRASMQNLVRACADGAGDLYRGIADSRWMNHLSSILKVHTHALALAWDWPVPRRYVLSLTFWMSADTNTGRVSTGCDSYCCRDGSGGAIYRSLL